MQTDIIKLIPLIVLAVCAVAVSIFGSNELGSMALNLLYLLAGSRLRF